MGRNPFGQSLMFGEGHDYAAQYTAMSGDMVGSLPVGIQTRENQDMPYWPAANCYNYKEVWVHPSSRWLGIMSDLFAPARNRETRRDVSLVRTEVGAQNGIVTVKAVVRGQGSHRVTLRSSNLAVTGPDQSVDLSLADEQTVTWQGRRQSDREPWIGVLVLDGNIQDRREVIGR